MRQCSPCDLRSRGSILLKLRRRLLLRLKMPEDPMMQSDTEETKGLEFQGLENVRKNSNIDGCQNVTFDVSRKWIDLCS